MPTDIQGAKSMKTENWQKSFGKLLVIQQSLLPTLFAMQCMLVALLFFLAKPLLQQKCLSLLSYFHKYTYTIHMFVHTYIRIYIHICIS